ncbi:unnamed protein product [Peniophora sp. CBMAI 1063]|nr:unnamed protein product [Peniophora sp. CBMAI 1063]
MGVRRRFEKTGKKDILINTSGTGVLAGDAKSMHDDRVTYDDNSVESIEFSTKATHAATSSSHPQSVVS